VLWISFEIISSCINAPLPVFLDVLEEVLKSTFWNAAAVLSWLSERLECQHSDDLPMLLSVVGIRKNPKVTNLENMSQEGIQLFEVLTKIL
jgi:hypothetical protein